MARRHQPGATTAHDRPRRRSVASGGGPRRQTVTAGPARASGAGAGSPGPDRGPWDRRGCRRRSRGSRRCRRRPRPRQPALLGRTVPRVGDRDHRAGQRRRPQEGPSSRAEVAGRVARAAGDAVEAVIGRARGRGRAAGLAASRPRRRRRRFPGSGRRSFSHPRDERRRIDDEVADHREAAERRDVDPAASGATVWQASTGRPSRSDGAGAAEAAPARVAEGEAWGPGGRPRPAGRGRRAARLARARRSRGRRARSDRWSGGSGGGHAVPLSPPGEPGEVAAGSRRAVQHVRVLLVHVAEVDRVAQLAAVEDAVLDDDDR